MKSILALVCSAVLFASPASAERAIYLKSDNTRYDLAFSFVNVADSIYLQIIEGYHNTESGGWIVTPKFLFKPTAPDDHYTVFVDGKQKQNGWLKNGLYTGYMWQPDYYDDRWMLIDYKNGEKQGAEKVFEHRQGKPDYFMATWQWYDNGHHPIKEFLSPSGNVNHYLILNHLHIVINADNTISDILEMGCEWRTINLPLVKGQLDGVARWYREGNGICTQVLWVTFKKNKLMKWELQETTTNESSSIIAHYQLNEK